MYTDSIRIKNFKSIKTLSLNDCKRINLLIGPPNVGKSNIMEALSLFDIPFHGSKNYYSDIIKPKMRIERAQQLFPYGNIKEPIIIETNHETLSLKLDSQRLQPTFELEIKKDGEIIYDSATPLKTDVSPEVLVYYYPRFFNFRASSLSFLRPPYGSNLMQIIKDNPELVDSLKSILKEYGYFCVFDSSAEEYKAMQQDEEGNVYLVPFEALADSIKHLLFFKAAVVSNHDKIICFEEPESNTFPPYTTALVDSILDSVNGNQYFISTHSSYIISHLLENSHDDLAIYKIGFKDGFTECYRLTDEEIATVIDYGMDLLFNIEAFPLKQ